MKRLFKLAKDTGAMEESPLKGIQQYKLPGSQKLSFEDWEVEKLLEEVDDPMMKNIVLFALLTGCRIGEILNLTWEDIDFNRMVIRIQNKPDFLTKTREEREIPIFNELHDFLTGMFDNKPKLLSLFNKK